MSIQRGSSLKPNTTDIEDSKTPSLGYKCSTLCSAPPLRIDNIPNGGTGESPLRAERQLSIFEIFKVGIGPSSSHTVGPMVAARRFATKVKDAGIIGDVHRVLCDLFGSLACTGIGHGTDKAVIVGLSGEDPQMVMPDTCEQIFARAQTAKRMVFNGERQITFNPSDDIIFHTKQELPQHPNGLQLSVYDANDKLLLFEEYFSIGGGFVQTASEMSVANDNGQADTSTHPSTPGNSSTINIQPTTTSNNDEDLLLDGSGGIVPVTHGNRHNNSSVPYPFSKCAQLIEICIANNLTMAEVVMENEVALSKGDRESVKTRILAIWHTMRECLERGLHTEGTLPVSNNLRTAATTYQSLNKSVEKSLTDHFAIMDWICVFARSVNEENASGGRIVTSPTNGAAGTLPAVLEYYWRFWQNSSDEGVLTFLLTAAAICTVVKMNASISGAEAGCQAEVGVACAMAAAGLTAATGGSIYEVENAAEIALEHNLGMTCDPIDGLVQIPCIERNSVAAVKAVVAHRLARTSHGSHIVSFDSCVEAMYNTGLDLLAKYRETSLGGLASFAKRPLPIRRSSLPPQPERNRLSLC